VGASTYFLSSLLLSSLEFSDTQVCEPQIRARIVCGYANTPTGHEHFTRVLLSSGYGTYKTFRARLWPWLSGRGP